METTKNNIYGNGERAEATLKFAQNEIDTINKALRAREEKSVVFNGMSYSDAYVYNMKKAINFAPPKSNKDSQISLGIIHEKLVSFVAIFLKYIFKPDIKCYDNNGNLVQGLGDIYKWAIEFSQKLEGFQQKLGVIYWEMFSQGDAFILEDWQVKNVYKPVAYKDGEKLNPEDMDFTYEFIDNLTFDVESKKQTRKAVSVLLDGRNVILDSVVLDSGIQEQTGITIEEIIDRGVAKQIYGSLSMWDKVPKTADDIIANVGNTVTLFGTERLKDAEKQVIVHRRFNKKDNKFNIFINGVAMLPYDTPLTIFYPRGNYPVTQFSTERMSGSAYSRSIPAKVKFNADYADWTIKMLARRFEQEMDPGLLITGKYTLVKDIFAPGARTHGVTKAMYDIANPDDKGLQASSFSFLNLLKDIQERQTVNPTTSGELTKNATATEIAVVENNQEEKLGYMLDGLVNGYIDLLMRRAETIESKYTIKQRETVIDDKTVDVFQNFTITSSGVQHKVIFDKSIGEKEYDVDKKRGELFTKAFESKKNGAPTEYYLVDPTILREGELILRIDIHTEKIKNTGLKLAQMQQEFNWLLSVFPNVNREEMEKEYLNISGRPDSMFIPQELIQAQQQTQAPTGAGAQPQPQAQPQPAVQTPQPRGGIIKPNAE